MKNKIHTLESDHSVSWDQTVWEEAENKTDYLQVAAEKAKQSCGFCRSDSWKASHMFSGDAS